MSNTRSTVTLCAGALACVIGAASGAAAQARFELLGGDAIGTVQGLSVYTIRDNRAGGCYTLFVLGALDAELSRTRMREPFVTDGDAEKIRVAEMLKEATAIHVRKIDELRSSRNLAFTVVQQDLDRQAIDEEYESTVRALLPRLYPPARIMPGTRSTSADELNDAVRQAIADADAVVARDARMTTEDQTLALLNRIARSPKLAVAGPVACAPAQGAAR